MISKTDLFAGMVSIAALGAAPAFADFSTGRIVLSGSGGASSPPEYVTVNVDVTSICYNTSQEAAATNAKLAQKIVAVLKGFSKSDRDKVTATGGASVRQTETIYAGNQPKVVCELKWRSENHLHLDMAQMQDLSELQDKIFEALTETEVTDPAIIARTYAEISRPTFKLYPVTAQKLRDQAQGMAFDDARKQFASLASKCTFVDPRIVSIAPPEFAYKARVYGAAGSDAAAATPVIPDGLEVRAALRIEWEFTPSAGCSFTMD